VTAVNDTAANRLEQLAVEARYHRQRYDLHRARMYALRHTAEARLRELQRSCESAEQRLAEARARAAGQGS